MVNSVRPSIVWFRDDLRLSDHPALSAAVEEGPVLCVYILDETSEGLRPIGGAARWWLHHSLASLDRELQKRGGCLYLMAGSSEQLLVALATETNARSVLWTRRYGRGERELDVRIATALKKSGIASRVFEGSLLHDPEKLKTRSGEFFRVFTPFWRRLKETLDDIPSPLRSPRETPSFPWPSNGPERLPLEALRLLPTKPDWSGGLMENWRPGEPDARRRLLEFLDGGLLAYAAERDSPALAATSRLSPHLRFGELSPRQLWRAAMHASDLSAVNPVNVGKFLSEIAWREFSYHLWYHAPDLRHANFNRSFDHFPWRSGESSEADAWRRGMTGFPIVDAGMRELWNTGYMHNRVRLIVASFLVKDLLIDWRVGESWFWDTLCDADPACNTANWQWCAGSGADAAPYFRIFNPVLQSRKFDPTGAYIRKFVPELRDLPDEWIHEPWACPPGVSAMAGVDLGKNYPRPIVDHGEARQKALAALRMTKAQA